MRKSVCLLGSILVTGVLMGFGTAAQASNVSNPQVQKACTGAKSTGAAPCAPEKTAERQAQAGTMKVAYGGFDRSNCHRLSNKVARDTCLNHFDGSA